MTIQTSPTPASTIVTLMPIFVAKPGRSADLERALLVLQTASRADNGCLVYSVFADLNDESRFVMHEEWVSHELLAAHNLQTHVIDFVDQTKDLLSEPFTVTWMRPIAPSFVAG
jgi:quinol monooxygenase YgiN